MEEEQPSDWIQNKLVDGEFILRIFHHHWLWYVRQIVPCVLGIVLFVVVAAIAPEFFLPAVIMTIIASMIAMIVHLRWRKKSFVVTSQRIFYTGGLINRLSHTDDLPLPAVGNIDGNFTGWLGGLFGEMDFDIQSGDTTSHIELCNYPSAVNEAVRQAQHQYNVNLHNPSDVRYDALGNPYTE